MLRKHNKFIMLLLLVTFMFSIIGSASATSFSDVTGTSVQSAAISRLNGLGVLDGYPDGTFGPDKTITRAEFAKIACVTAGLKSVASGMGGTASSFSDVATNHWANGWINVAAAQGFVKGYPDGTFKPEAQITQAEVITVLMRLLGYNDNLAGNWPSDYIAKAANLGDLDDITFVANQAATRGVVAVLASAVLDENIVEYAASDNLFNEVTPVKTLLADKFDKATSIEKALIMQFSVDNDGKYTIYYNTYDETTGAISAQLTSQLATTCTFGTAGSILGVNEHFADLTLDKDGKVIAINVKDYTRFGPMMSDGTLLTKLKVDGGKLDVNGTKYSFAKTAIVGEAVNTEFDSRFTTAYTSLMTPVTGTLAVASAVGATPAQIAAAVADLTTIHTVATENTILASNIADKTYDTADAYAVFLNKDNEVAGLRAYTFPTSGVVDKVIGDRVYYLDNASPAVAGNPLAALNPACAAFGLGFNFSTIGSNANAWSGFANQGNFKDQDIYVQRDSKPATLADIQPLDTVSVLKDYRGCDYYLVVTSAKIPGTLTSAQYSGTDVKKLTVSGKDWTVAYKTLAKTTYGASYSVDSGATFEGALVQGTLNNDYDMWGNDVKLLMGPTMKVSATVFGDASADAKMYGVVTEISGPMAWSDGTTVRNLKLMKSDGEEYSYPISDDTYIKKAGPIAFNSKIKDLTAAMAVNGVKRTLATIDDTIQPFGITGEAVAGLVSVSLNSDGLVNRVEVLPTASVGVGANIDTDNDLVKLTDWCAASDVVVYNMNNNAGGPATSISTLDKTKVVGWSELKKALTATIISYYQDTNKNAKYVLINAAPMSSGANYGIYESQYSDSDNWIKFVGQDAYKLATPVALTKGDVVRFTKSGSDVTVAATIAAYGAAATYTVKSINGNAIVLSPVAGGADKSLKTDSDTVYFNNSDDTDLQVLTSVSVGDAVKYDVDAIDTQLITAIAVVD